MGKERKNFSIKVIEEVFEEQGRCCAKCGESLIGGFEAHHKDANSSNNDKENCELLCVRCHDAKLWETLKLQKEESIGQLRVLINQAIEGKMAGAVIDKVLDAIKLKLSLERQTSEVVLMEAPATSRIEYSEAIAEYNLKEWLRGMHEGFILGVEWTSGKKEEKRK
jgi:hypothetical protein